MIRVLIVDDHPLVRKGIKSELMDQPDIRVVDEATTGEDALVKARSSKPDVIVLDISLPGRSGLDVLQQLIREMPGVKILMLSIYPEKQYAVRSLKSGALGYLAKESASEELTVAIRKVAAGRRYVSETFAELLASEVGETRDELPHERLSGREFEIFCLIGKGKSSTEIGAILSISISTVSTHRAHITAKTGLHTNAEIIHYSLDHGLILEH